jgi:hypothetical protein
LALSFFARCTCFFSSFSWAIFCFFSSISFNSCSLNGQLFGIPGSFLDSRGRKVSMIAYYQLTNISLKLTAMSCWVLFCFSLQFAILFLRPLLILVSFGAWHSLTLYLCKMRRSELDLSPMALSLHISLKNIISYSFVDPLCWKCIC